VDDWLTADRGLGTPPIVDMGAYEHPVPGDCDGSGEFHMDDFANFANCMGGPYGHCGRRM
jgi:hypothetical protein